MSKKNRKRSQEVPRVGNALEVPRTENALEVPNYVIPTTDLEYTETVNGTRDPAEARESGRTQNRGEHCGEAKNCRN